MALLLACSSPRDRLRPPGARNAHRWRRKTPGADSTTRSRLGRDWDDPWATRAGGFSWNGFAEGGLGARWSSVENLDALTLGELRLRAETRYDHGSFRVDFKGDLAWDQVTEEHRDAQLRELAVAPSARRAACATSSSGARSSPGARATCCS
jgi:hypothetical protein